MLIVYETKDEVLICKKKHEKRMLRDWFDKGGRDIEDYDRHEEKDVCVVIQALLNSR